MRKLPYKIPTIVRGKKYWHVAYFYELPDTPGKFKKFQVKDGVNYFSDLAQREVEIQQLRNDIELALKNGYSPFHTRETIDRQSKKQEDQIEEENKIERWTIQEGFKHYLESCKKKNLSHNTIRTYRNFINNFESWLVSYNIHNNLVADFEVKVLNQFLDESFDSEEWSPRTYNNYITFFKTFFEKTFRLERKVNPELKYKVIIDDLESKKDRAEKNRYYTQSVAEKLKKEFAKKPNLYNYAKWIYYSCMRPREISLLQVQHIDLETRQIKAIAPTAKTGDRFIPICDELYDMIKEMKLMSAPYGSYVFGKLGKTSLEKINKDHFRNAYRPIKLKIGLDDNYTLYGWKHTRVVNLLNAGFSDNEVMSLTGHKDYKSFQAYKRGFILDNTVMKGKTIDF